MSAITPSPMRQTQSVLPHGTRLGVVRLGVAHADQALAVWRDLVGLTLLKQDEKELTLGVDGRPLIILELGATAKVQRGTVGLYHVAIHVPDRHALAVTIARLYANKYPNSPTDHLYTETTYLWDADGNGIELTFETPERGHFVSEGNQFAFRDNEGNEHSGRERLDLDSLFSELKEGEDLSAPMPAGTRIGHVHVHVRDLDQAMEFYSDVLGFGRQMMSYEFGMGDVMQDYVPHILAFNIWNGVHAKPAPAGAAGLRHYELILPDSATREALIERVKVTGGPVETVDQQIFIADPVGNRILLSLDQA